MRFLNREGKRYGRLVVISPVVGRRKRGSLVWLCRCDCGKITKVEGVSLGRNTNSCGCLKRERINKTFTTHGMRQTRFYRIWAGMLQRCDNAKNPDYRHYGGRKIKYFRPWNKFENFRDDMHEGYVSHCKKFGEKNTTLDRINNNGDYCKDNCRWATRKEQSNNTSRLKWFSYQGRKYNISLLASLSGQQYDLLYSRLVTRGWSVEKAINTPRYSHS